jgi:CBS domain-containing protein
MNVKTILAAKGHDVVLVQPQMTLSEAAQVMTENRVGAVVILGSEHRIVGILSERDIVRALARRGAKALDEEVSQVMTREVMTCTEDETTARVMSRMTAGRFRHLPVMKANRLIGIVSIGDVVKNRVEEIENESEALRDYIRTA